MYCIRHYSFFLQKIICHKPPTRIVEPSGISETASLVQLYNFALLLEHVEKAEACQIILIVKLIFQKRK